MTSSHDRVVVLSEEHLEQLLEVADAAIDAASLNVTHGPLLAACDLLRTALQQPPVEQEEEYRVVQAARELVAVYRVEYAAQDEDGQGTQKGLDKLVAAVETMDGGGS